MLLVCFQATRTEHNNASFKVDITNGGDASWPLQPNLSGSRAGHDPNSDIDTRMKEKEHLSQSIIGIAHCHTKARYISLAEKTFAAWM